MKKINSKKKFLNAVLFAIIFLFSFVFKNAGAVEKWIYWIDDPSNEVGSITINGSFPFSSKPACEASLAQVGPGHTKSTNCYIPEDAKISNVSLVLPTASGMAGDVVDISGNNLLGVTEIYFGTVKSNNSYTVDSNTAKAEIPVGAVTSKIIVKTKYHGETISPKEFNVVATPVNTDHWVFLNVLKNYIGESETKPECLEKLNAYKNDPANGLTEEWKKGADCVQRTQEEIKKSRATGPVSVSTKKNASSDDTYTLLAPIPGLTEINTKGGTCPGNPDIDNGVGCYLNIIFKIAIGLCGALAVIMIVIAGIEYMGTESIFGKTEAKSKIFSALMGLFIALGAYAILNTINPDLTGSKGVNVDQVEAVIDARDRADDPDFINNIDSLDISNININTSDYSDPSFLGYLAHQQGSAGASAILWAAKNGYGEVPASNPFARGNILRNMRNNFNSSSAQKTIGTSTLTPANFLKYWAVKVAAAKRKTSPQIPSFIDNELQKASTDTGVDIGQLRTMCRIESLKGCTDASPEVVGFTNKFGYTGLFQLSKGVFSQYGKSGGDIKNVYHNSFAAAQFYKFNLNSLNKNWDRINKK